MQKAMYVTDDRDLPDEDQRSLVIFCGGNGDWYVQVAPKHGMTTEGVRICTSGGASTQCPGLGVAIAEAYRAMLDAQQNVKRERTVSRNELEEEVRAWQTRFPELRYEFFEIVDAEGIFDQEIDHQHAWSISSRLAAISVENMEKMLGGTDRSTIADLIGLVREAKELHPFVAKRASERDLIGESGK